MSSWLREDEEGMREKMRWVGRSGETLAEKESESEREEEDGAVIKRKCVFAASVEAFGIFS